MHPFNHFQKPFLIVYCTLAFVIILSLLVPKETWKKYHLSQVNLLADIEVRKPAVKTKRNTYQPRIQARPQKELIKDTVPANAAVTSLIRTDVAIETPDTVKVSEGLSLFLEKLHELEKDQHRKVRIAYFGDSMIEGDLITQTIRGLLQNKFGGNGVGFIPITSIVSRFRQTVRADANENWEDVNYTQRKNKRAIGISGHSFFAQEDAQLTVKPGGGRHLSSLYRLSLLCGSDSAGLSLTFNDSNIHAKTTGPFNVIPLSKTDMAKAKIHMNESRLPLYGLASESKEGVILDNLSFRGTSGTELLRLNSRMLHAIDSLRTYDLIVLQYGPNLLYADSIRNFGWYRHQIEKSIRHLKKAFPHASILVISTADKSFKIDGEYQTGEGVEALLEAQKTAARKTHSAFYNLYEAMGGYNSMKTWAEKRPILAGSDYTHFNQSGSAKIGRLIANAILNEYEKKYPAK